MTLHALEIPEQPAQLPDWLERHLVGLDLRQLVNELSMVHGADGRVGPTLEKILGVRRKEVLEQGLRALPAAVLQQLLERPSLLLELQELILVEGGPYWDRATAPTADLATVADRGRQRFDSFLAALQPSLVAAPPVLLLAKREHWFRRPWAVSLATAATGLIAVALHQHFYPPLAPPETVAAKPWGWNQPGALPDHGSPSAYLNTLADEADEWFLDHPADSAALALRLSEFRAGCSRLVFAPHQPLSVEDRQWLVESCRVWGQKLDKRLVALEAGQDWHEVEAETDQLIRQIMASFHERAKQLSSLSQSGHIASRGQLPTRFWGRTTRS